MSSQLSVLSPSSPLVPSPGGAVLSVSSLQGAWHRGFIFVLVFEVGSVPVCPSGVLFETGSLLLREDRCVPCRYLGNVLL